jgi:hypothetical protein
MDLASSSRTPKENDNSNTDNCVIYIGLSIETIGVHKGVPSRFPEERIIILILCCAALLS